MRTGEMEGEFLEQVTGAIGAQVHMAIVSLADQTIELLEYRGPERPAAPSRPFDPGSAHLGLEADDIDAVLSRIAAHGWRAQGVPQAIAAGARAGTRVIYAIGPDGATIEFMRPSSAVRSADRPCACRLASDPEHAVRPVRLHDTRLTPTAAPRRDRSR